MGVFNKWVIQVGTVVLVDFVQTPVSDEGIIGAKDSRAFVKLPSCQAMKAQQRYKLQFWLDDMGLRTAQTHTSSLTSSVFVVTIVANRVQTKTTCPTSSHLLCTVIA